MPRGRRAHVGTPRRGGAPRGGEGRVLVAQRRQLPCHCRQLLAGRLPLLRRQLTILQLADGRIQRPGGGLLVRDPLTDLRLGGLYSGQRGPALRNQRSRERNTNLRGMQLINNVFKTNQKAS